MSADTLRRAASLMRERARAATEGPWQFEPEGDCECGEPGCCSEYWDNRIWADGAVIAESHLTNEADSTHIASWHPAVALAVADWLDAYADAFYTNGTGTTDRAALTVARIYLGETT